MRTPARASPSATLFARGISGALHESGTSCRHKNAVQVRLHEKCNTGDSEYILSKNENGFTRYKV